MGFWAGLVACLVAMAASPIIITLATECALEPIAENSGIDCHSAPECCAASSCYVKSEFFSGCLETCAYMSPDPFDLLPFRCHLFLDADLANSCDDGGTEATSAEDVSTILGPLTVEGGILVASDLADDFRLKPVQLVGLSVGAVNGVLSACADAANVGFLVTDWGVTLLKAEVDAQDVSDPAVLTALVDDVAVFVALTKTLGIYVLVTWQVRANPGNAGVQASAVSFWTEASTRFAAETHVLYEIFGTPVGGSAVAIKAASEALITTVRQFDTEAIIIAPMSGDGQGIAITAANEVADGANVVYGFNFVTKTDQALIAELNSAMGIIPLVATSWAIGADGGVQEDRRVASLLLDLLGGLELAVSPREASWVHADIDSLFVTGCPLGGTLTCGGQYVRKWIRRSHGATVIGGAGNGGVTGAPTDAPTNAPTDAPVGGGDEEENDDDDDEEENNGLVILGASLGAVALLAVVVVAKRRRASLGVSGGAGAGAKDGATPPTKGGLWGLRTGEHSSGYRDSGISANAPTFALRLGSLNFRNRMSTIISWRPHHQRTPSNMHPVADSFASMVNPMAHQSGQSGPVFVVAQEQDTRYDPSHTSSSNYL